MALYTFKRYRRTLPTLAPTAGQLVQEQAIEAADDAEARLVAEVAHVQRDLVWKTDFAMLYNEDGELVLLWLDENHA